MNTNEKEVPDSVRQEFLFRMYDQMFNDINRHITIVWQPITVLFGSIGLLAAGTADIISIHIAEALIILLVGWLIATLYDSTYWYNRNIVIIANIERQFLRKSDLKDIHYYFGEHRAKQSVLTHIEIQKKLGLFVGFIVLLHHFLTQILGMCTLISPNPVDFQWEMVLPYVAALIALIWAHSVRKYRITSYESFIKNSPGIEIDTEGIEYGAGHPVDK